MIDLILLRDRWRGAAEDDRESVIAVLDQTRRHAPTPEMGEAFEIAAELLREMAGGG